MYPPEFRFRLSVDAQNCNGIRTYAMVEADFPVFTAEHHGL